MGFLCNKQKTVSVPRATEQVEGGTGAAGGDRKQTDVPKHKSGQGTAGIQKHPEHSCLPGQTTSHSNKGEEKKGCFPPGRWNDK